VTVNTYPVGVGPAAARFQATLITLPFRVTEKFAGVPAATQAAGNVSVTGFDAALEPDPFAARTANV
jgi:hypothetical protein